VRQLALIDALIPENFMKHKKKDIQTYAHIDKKRGRDCVLIERSRKRDGN
jgi:hypothetical protein